VSVSKLERAPCQVERLETQLARVKGLETEHQAVSLPHSSGFGGTARGSLGDLHGFSGRQARGVDHL